MKIEHIKTGVMLVLNGKAWGVNYSDGRETSYGWMEPSIKTLYDPRFYATADRIAGGSHYLNEARKGVVVKATITTTVEINDNE